MYSVLSHGALPPNRASPGRRTPGRFAACLPKEKLSSGRPLRTCEVRMRTTGCGSASNPNLIESPSRILADLVVYLDQVWEPEQLRVHVPKGSLTEGV